MTATPDASSDTDMAERVLTATVDAAVEVLREQLASVYALGSLAHGGFAPLVSDVDVALVLAAVDGAVTDQIAEVAARARARVRDPLSDRLSIFWSDWRGVRHGADGRGRLPEVDRLDLLESGRLLHGLDQREPAEFPAKSALVRGGANHARAGFDRGYLELVTDPSRLLDRGVRRVTKVVLFPVRFLYTLETGRIGLNAAAVEWYAARGPSAELVGTANSWRTTGITDPARAMQLLAEHLPALYQEFFGTYEIAMTAAGEHELADALAERSRWLAQSGHK